MEALYIYLIKSSGLIALFYLAYYFMLRKETFFTSNRWFLLLGLFTSAVLPLVVYTKIIMVESSSKNIDWSRIPITNSIENEPFEINWYIVFGITYAIGIILFMGKFVFDFYSLNTVLKGKTIQNQADFKFIDTTENVAPFSYFNTIVYNSSLYSSSELENILEHEKVHSDQNHTVDVLISRLFCILFWFNPLIWLYKKVILQNLEFIADNEATKKISDKKAYQFTLLKITTHENCVAITNHFYQSLIKKRIVMLNKNQSKKSNSWKYALVLPALIAFVLLFQIKTIAQEKNEIKIEKYSVKTEFHITSKSTTEELNSIKKFFKDENDLEISFSGIKTNKNDEIIAIKVKLKDKKGSQKIYQTSEETPIKSFTIFAENDINNNLNFGFSANLKDNAHLKNHFDHVNALNTPKDEVAPNTEVKEIPVPPTPPNAKVFNTNNQSEKPLIIINGKKANPSLNLDEIDPNTIATVNVLKDKNAVDKYGEQAIHGAVEVITKDNKGWGVSFGTFAPEDNITRIQNDKNVDYKKAVIIINGQISDYQAFDKLKPEEIDNMSVEKISTNLEARKIAMIKKYGEKAINGIIEIETKEFKKK
ncbi:M56 family metallopeptidase [Flavobacterium yafengii]|uniref:M56 family metallopeptidase n=1 Tax=Flavobacterium yafengii TaxID=3041253 RepID=UPI0024A9739C|nr:M56 family metallopeptidase [Flavobacterium yafengii]MDI5888336.1 M56 family metallopeptidase [Flavobacterium yafengii]